jgi:hypothetical protein
MSITLGVSQLLVIEHELGSEAVYAPALTKKST